MAARPNSGVMLRRAMEIDRMMAPAHPNTADEHTCGPVSFYLAIESSATEAIHFHVMCGQTALDRDQSLDRDGGT